MPSTRFILLDAVARYATPKTETGNAGPQGYSLVFAILKHTNLTYLYMTNAKILIVEDEAIIAMEILDSIENLGYEVTATVNSGAKALDSIEKDRPDLVLMDIRIKGLIDGIDTAEIIRNRFGIPVVFSTAYLDEGRIERAKITMPFGYVLKPIQERDLKVTLEMALYIAIIDAEKQEIDRRLEESEEKYRLAFYTSPDAVNINRLDGLYVDINEGFTRLTGFTRADAIGKLSSEINIWAIPEDRVKLVAGLQSKGHVENLESQFRCKDGSLITALMSASMFKLNNEPHILSITRDITERKRIEAKLQEGELIFTQQFYQSSTSMCLYNPEGTIERANPEFCRMFGVEEVEIVASQYNMFRDQAIRVGGVIPHLEKVFHQKEKANWDVIFDIDLASRSTGARTARNGKLELEVFAFPILDRAGELLHVVLQHYDVSERKQAERALKESESKYRELFQKAPAGIYSIDFRNFRITEINELACSNIGYTRQEILDMPDPLILLEPPSRQKFLERMERIKNREPVPTIEEFNFRRKDGAAIRTLLSIQFVYEGREIVGARVVGHDITG